MNDKKRIAFRVDASITLGGGHVMRCLALANEFKHHSITCIFICRDHPGEFTSKIKAAGHMVYLLPQHAFNQEEDFKINLGSNIMQDVAETSAILNKLVPQWLVIDHYDIDDSWINLFKESDKNKTSILVIDGQANRKFICNALVDPTYHSLGEKRWETLVNIDCKLFVGPKYMPLRKEFNTGTLLSSIKNNAPDLHSHVLLTFGAIDEPNATQTVLSTLLSFNHSNITFDVVLGEKNPNIQKLKKIYGECKNVILHVEPPNIVDIFSRAQFAIIAGGSTVWELCSLGKPMLIVSIAHNQVASAKSLNDFGCAIYIGDIKQFKNNQNKVIDKLKDNFEGLHLNKSLNNYMGEKAKTLMSNQTNSLIQFILDRIQ